MVKKTALITGITGQDGALLTRYLLTQNYTIIAATRKDPDLSRLEELNIKKDQSITFVVYNKWSDFDQIIEKYLPDEVYHLAAISHVGLSHQQPNKVFDVNTSWTISLLNAIYTKSPQSKLFFASSSEIFQKDIAHLISENDNKIPTNPYGISKLSAHLMVQYYRDANNLFACNGILFNHESKLRSDSFVSKKICKEVARIVKFGGAPLYLGNIEAKKDWGYAPDYVAAFHMMLQQNTAQDFIISSAQLHSVKDMVNAAFEAFNYAISWQGSDINCKAINAKGEIVVAIDENFFRPLDNRYLKGNNTKAKLALGLNHLTPFNSWIKTMTLSEYEKLS